MTTHKYLNMMLAMVMLTTLLLGGVSPTKQVAAMPMSETDESVVPHYFGPYPNWANSPFTYQDVTVVIDGDGQGAAAIATVGANGAITGVTITDPGHSYTYANVNFQSDNGSGASATAEVNLSGVVTRIVVGESGGGYVSPYVTVSGGGGIGAAATAYGGVDVLTLTNGGSGYTFPTVDFDMPDAPDGVRAKAHAVWDPDTGVITEIVLDNPGSGYSTAPNVVIRDGTLYDPISNGGGGAEASATLFIQSVSLDDFGTGYTSAPDVAIFDAGGAGSGATATAFTDVGAITNIVLTAGGSGYITPGGIRKFVDTLPGLGSGGANNLGQYIPVAVPDTTTFEGADYYEIAIVEYWEQMHSDLPPTQLRGYVQLETNQVQGIHYPLPGGKFGVDRPHYLGPAIVAQKDRAVRITFYNLLPTGMDGDLFLPVDSTIMGSGMGPMETMMEPMDESSVMDEVRNPMCTDDANMMGDMCFAKNRATLHLHGGNVPWISDGTPHQWITPAGESTMWPEGVSVESVPDMVGDAAIAAGIPDCSEPDDGCMTFYYQRDRARNFRLPGGDCSLRSIQCRRGGYNAGRSNEPDGNFPACDGESHLAATQGAAILDG